MAGRSTTIGFSFHFAQEQNPGLDITTPPKRPDPKQSINRMLQILDEPAAGR
jgi:hypothetical protein